jgi:hypothetical protein
VGRAIIKRPEQKKWINLSFGLTLFSIFNHGSDNLVETSEIEEPICFLKKLIVLKRKTEESFVTLGAPRRG